MQSTIAPSSTKSSDGQLLNSQDQFQPILNFAPARVSTLTTCCVQQVALVHEGSPVENINHLHCQVAYTTRLVLRIMWLGL